MLRVLATELDAGSWIANLPPNASRGGAVW